MPPVLDQVQQSPPPAQEREGTRLRRAYEEKKGRSYTMDDLGPDSRRAVSNLISPDAGALIDVLRRMRSVNPGREGYESARGTYVPEEEIPVPADNPTLINLFQGLLEKMRAGPTPTRKLRYESVPSHGKIG